MKDSGTGWVDAPSSGPKTAQANSRLTTIRGYQGPRRNRRIARAKRHEGALYDVIDEWLAPAFARWLASREAPPAKETF
jgi:hypothetical protein